VNEAQFWALLSSFKILLRFLTLRQRPQYHQAWVRVWGSNPSSGTPK